MTILAVASGLVTAAWVLLAALLPRALREVPRADEKAVATGARVSVIVPAHDEEALIRRCVSSIAAQDAPAHEIIVVDDHSSDQTANVAAQAGARVVKAADRPGGWLGKPWAAWQGAQAASGELLLFVDADAILSPGCLRAVVASAEKTGADLLAALPRAACATFAEALLQPVMLLMMMWQFDPRRVNDPNDDVAAAPGSFLLFRRAAYDRVGGHTAVRAEIVEDLKLAQLVKKSGMTLRLVAAPHLVATRRALSLRALLNSWFRVGVDGVGRNPLIALAALAAILVLFLGPYALAPLGIALVVIAAAHLVTTRVVRAQLARAYGFDDRWAWLQPLGALMAWLLFWRVLFASLAARGPEKWR